MSVPTRVYVVRDQSDQSIQLINASNPTQAVRHVSRTRYDVYVASQRDLIEHLPNVRVENAGIDTGDAS